MGKLDESRIDGFPSDFVDPKLKSTEKYALQYAKAFAREHQNKLTHPGFGWSDNRKHELYKYRKYARAEQSTDQYKTLFTHQRAVGKGKKNLSYTNIDHSILPIAPRMIENLIGKILKIEMEPNLRAIDPVSVSEKRKKKHEILSYMANRGFLEKLSKSKGIDLLELSPIPEGVPEPNDELNLDQYVDLFFKNQAMLEFHDFIQVVMEANKKDQVLQDCVRDLIEIGILGMKAYMDRNGKVKFRRVIIEETICNPCREDDFSDLSRIGEYIYVTISELRTMWPDQPESTYLEIAKKGNRRKYPGDVGYYQSVFEENNTYPYDDEKVIILDFEWKSSDQISKIVKTNKKGEKKVYDKDYNYWAGIDPDEYKEKNPDRDMISRVDDNWYGAKWIVGTDHVFDCGLVHNMLRDSTNMSNVYSNYIIRRTKPIMKNIIPMLDNIQLNFLKYQQHLIHSLPRNIIIEMTALENLSLGKGGDKMKPKEALALYFETGIMLWRRTHWRGSEAQFKPIEDLNKGVPNGAEQHLKMIIDGIDLLRYLSGVPEVADATVSNPDIGKGVTERLIESAYETVRTTVNMYRFSFESLCRKVLDLTVDSVVHYDGKYYQEALGIDSVRFIEIVKDISMRELGIIIEAGPDDAKIQFVQQMILEAQAAGSLDPETAFMLGQEKNPYRVVMILKQKTAENRQLAAQAEQNQVQAELDKNVQSTNIAAQNDIEKEKVIGDIKKELAAFQSQLNNSEKDKDLAHQVILNRLHHENNLEEGEQKYLSDLIGKVIAATQKGEAPAKAEATRT